ncbi:hypothetical protein BXY51_001929 [Actinoplanes cyaneus]|nr:hypothetical protein [Actinoplanes cyaneus]
MIDCTERQPAGHDSDLAGEGRESMTRLAQ